MTLEFRKENLYKIIIEPLAIGFVVTAGCCKAAFTTKQEVINAVNEYLKEPDAVEKKYNDSAGNRPTPEEGGASETAPDMRQQELRPPNRTVEARVEARVDTEAAGDCCDEQCEEAAGQPLNERGYIE